MSADSRGAVPRPCVLVAGGGPAGLMSALLLARQGIPVTVVERRTGLSTHPKARGINVRTMEILRGLSLEEPIRAAGALLAKSKYMLAVESLAGRETQRIEDDDLMMKGEALERFTPCTWTQCAQYVLEALLGKHAREAGAVLRYGTELSAFTQDARGVTCQLRDGASGKETTLSVDYLLGCDGADSFVRRSLGIPLEGRAAIEHFINIHFRADLRRYVEGRWFGICFVENPAVQGLFLPVNNDDEWLLNVQYRPTVTPLDQFTEERCRELVRAAVGDESLDLQILSKLPWVASALVVPHMQMNRVFLLGDAAHVMPPAGAFGLNAAVQDAHNLAWKIAYVLRGDATPQLLHSYEQERLPIARDIVRYAEREMEAPEPWQHDADSRQDIGNPWERSLEDQLIEVIGFQYQSDAVLPGAPLDQLDLRGQPGTRFPHLWLSPGRSTLDVIGDTLVIMTSSEDPAPPPSSSIPVVHIPKAAWHRLVGEEDRRGMLVRPDGIVAARGNTAELAADWARIATRTSPAART